MFLFLISKAIHGAFLLRSTNGIAAGIAAGMSVFQGCVERDRVDLWFELQWQRKTITNLMAARREIIADERAEMNELASN